MKRDTPPDDMPAVVAMPEADPVAALHALRSVETLEAAYEVWEELERAFDARAQHRGEEQQRLEGEGRFLLGAVRAAGNLSGEPAETTALASAPPLQRFLNDAEDKLAQTRRELEAKGEAEARSFETAFEEIEQTLEARVRRYASAAPPRLVLWRRPAGSERAVLHLASIPPDTAIVLLFLATGRIARRYDFLTDERTDAPDNEPPSFYGPGDRRPLPREFPTRSRPEGRVSPVQGFVPVYVPRPGQTEVFYRFRQRGPVLEAEVLDGEGFRSILTAPEAELLAGQLLRWKLAGSIDLDLRMG